MGPVRPGPCACGRAAPAPAVGSVGHRAVDAARRSPLSPLLRLVLASPLSSPFSPRRPQRRAAGFPRRRRRRPSHAPVAVTVTGVAAASGPARCRPLSESSSAPRRRARIQSRCAPHPSLPGGASESACAQCACVRARMCVAPATLPPSLSLPARFRAGLPARSALAMLRPPHMGGGLHWPAWVEYAASVQYARLHALACAFLPRPRSLLPEPTR